MADTVELSRAALDVIAERLRHTTVEGWTAEHDDEHDSGQMARAAACYAIGLKLFWPWEARWWKPADPRRNLVKAGALILAEIERLDRAAVPCKHKYVAHDDKGRQCVLCGHQT